jgi:alpha-beta hydrolase superfamily lysophospholipase
MTTQNTYQWQLDTVLPGFEAAELRFPDDYDGPVCATLIRRKAPQPAQRAVLYIHGWTDYFFQTHLADEFTSHGYNFYALDLRKYGRSIQGAKHPNYCRDVNEYFAEISMALRIMTEQDGNTWVVLNGHSTGGLTGSLYADHGAERQRINALILNSPFFDFNLNRRDLTMIKLLAGLADVFPFAQFPRKAPSPYIESIHVDHHGEWSFDLRWRPLFVFPAYGGWIRAILRAHKQIQHGLALHCPVLVMHSTESIWGDKWHAGFQKGDSVLNVAHIREGSRHLESNVTVREIQDGLHDLVLSRLDVRVQVFAVMFQWLAGLRQA